MQHLVLVTVPNGNDSAEANFATISSRVSYCKLHKITVPPLVVGTLDSLISLSDELAKINNQVENVVRKVERQYLEVGTSGAEPLRINSGSVETFLRKFTWDNARYQHQGRSLNDLVGQIQGMAAKVDEELKKLSIVLAEKQSILVGLQRRKTVNLATSDFEDFLTTEYAARLDILSDPESVLQTVFIVMSKSTEAEFLRSYETIGANIVTYTSDNRSGNTEKGSPVVPNSAKKIIEEGETVMYSIAMIKNHYKAGHFEGDLFVPGTVENFIEPLRSAFRDIRCTLREFSYEGNRPGGLDGQIAEAKTQADAALSTMTRWCQSHFGEVYSGWVHLKVIRAFVESVLRYGLPVNFLAMFVEPAHGKEKQMINSLCSVVARVCPSLQARKSNEEGEEEDEEAIAEGLPFVFQKFGVIGYGPAGSV